METHCRECGVKIGKKHKPGCFKEYCPACGGQAIQCLKEIKTKNGKIKLICENTDTEVDKKELIPFYGERPGINECREYGLFCYWDKKNNTWVSCDVSHPEAIEDLNTLHMIATWNRKLQRFVKD